MPRPLPLPGTETDGSVTLSGTLRFEASPAQYTEHPCDVEINKLTSEPCARPSEGKVTKIRNTTTLLPWAWIWTLYPGPVLDVRDQHSQSGFHCVPQELVCLPLLCLAQLYQLLLLFQHTGEPSVALGHKMQYQLTAITPKHVGRRTGETQRLGSLGYGLRCPAMGRHELQGCCQDAVLQLLLTLIVLLLLAALVCVPGG